MLNTADITVAFTQNVITACNAPACARAFAASGDEETASLLRTMGGLTTSRWDHTAPASVPQQPQQCREREEEEQQDRSAAAKRRRRQRRHGELVRSASGRLRACTNERQTEAL